MQVKHCNFCGQTKPLTEFYRDRKGNVRAGCKACQCAAQRVRAKGYYHRNPKGCKARQRRWAKRHPDTVRQYAREAMRRHRQKIEDGGRQQFFSLDDPRLGVAARLRKTS